MGNLVQFSSNFRTQKFLFIAILVLFPAVVLADGECDGGGDDHNKSLAQKYKYAAIASIFVASLVGVCLPLLGKKFPSLSPENDVFFVIKAFAAGVILSTGFIHVLPDAFDSLTSSCLPENPWGKFPFTGFVAMMAAIGTLMVDVYATSHYKRKSGEKANQIAVGDGVLPVHTHASHGHSHGSIPTDSVTTQLRYRVISQAKFKGMAITVMAIFLSLTPPVGIAIGMGILKVYNENSPNALNAASAGNPNLHSHGSIPTDSVTTKLISSYITGFGVGNHSAFCNYWHCFRRK